MADYPEHGGVPPRFLGRFAPRCAPRHSTAGRIGVHHRTGSDLAQDDRRQLDAEVEDARGFASD